MKFPTKAQNFIPKHKTGYKSKNHLTKKNFKKRKKSKNHLTKKIIKKKEKKSKNHLKKLNS
jgi:hypothetical protein